MRDRKRLVQLHQLDNVAVALEDMRAGEQIGDFAIVASEPIPCGHKVALTGIAADTSIVKYGQTIGYASCDIAAGSHVHVHNCAVGEVAHAYEPCRDASKHHPGDEPVRSFKGYLRPSGKVGTRNYIGVLTTVNCSGTVAKHIAREVATRGVLDDQANIDGVVALTHGTGCCMAGQGDGFDNLLRLLSGYALHPNFAGVLVIGLGCEVMQIAKVASAARNSAGANLRCLTIQDEGGTRQTIDQGIAIIREMVSEAAQVQRTEQPASSLSIALQCGGSDGYSGLTANPALGYACDLVVAQGGTVILSETPEIYGAEHLLIRRAATPEVADKLIERIRWWEDYTRRNGGTMDNNPTPGNKAGGITTIFEKSLGAIAKAGSTDLTGVYRYGELVDRNGFVFMDGPGFDPAALTGQVASGANLICFTTGRGSVYGYKPAPSLKLATNTEMYERMVDDMDINCGPIIEGSSTVEEKGREIFEQILSVASGAETKSEKLGFGDCEFVPWQIGAVM